MKSIFKSIFVLSIAMLFGSCVHQKISYDDSNLRGRIKSIDEKHFTAVKNNGKWENKKATKEGDNKVFFDENGRCVSTEFLRENGNLRAKMLYKYENDRLKEKHFQDEKGRLVYKILYYPQNKEIVEYAIHNNKGLKTEDGKLFYKKGLLVKKENTIYDKKSSIESIVFTNEYDKRGALLKQEQIRDKGKNITLSYEYIEFDKKKNWTKRIEKFISGGKEEVIITIREYEYF